jgi:hypothetical protein
MGRKKKVEEVVTRGNLRRHKLDGLVNPLQDAAAIGLFQREDHLMGKSDEDS